MASPTRKDIKTFWIEAEWVGSGVQAAAWAPAVDMQAFANQLVACVDLAGVPRSAVRVEASACELRICGERPTPVLEGDTPLKLIQMEVPHGPFARRLRLPSQIDPARISTEYRDGFLWIVMPLVD